MKKYLIVKNYIYGTYQTDQIEKKDLLDIKERMTEAIIDITNQTYFDPKSNQWVQIGEKKNPEFNL